MSAGERQPVTRVKRNEDQSCAEHRKHDSGVFGEQNKTNRFISIHVHATNIHPNTSLPKPNLSHASLKLLLLPKKHAKTNNRPINQQSPNNTHNHSLHANQITMREHNGQRNPHHHQETRNESSKFHDGIAGPGVHEVVVAVRFAADPVG